MLLGANCVERTEQHKEETMLLGANCVERTEQHKEESHEPRLEC